MQATKIPKAKKNLLLCFDAFGTLFTPSLPIPVAYARAAARHGIDCGDTEDPQVVGSRFKEAFNDQSKRNPNYGRATGLGAEKWWGNVGKPFSFHSLNDPVGLNIQLANCGDLVV